MTELVMKYQQYEEYKDSGVEWLGEIPKDWSTISLKRKASFITGMTPSTAISAYYSDDVTIYEWVRPEDIKENTEKVCGTKYLTELGWRTQRKVTKNSVLLCCIGTIGKAGYASKTITTNQQITAVSFKDNSKYNYYLLLAARNELEQMATGNVVKILNSERLGQLSIPKVDLYQENQIASFLDHETAQIDTLIEKQQTLIQLLKEKRQAVISHAVTKGLNPDAPMKDSGVEWLGEVPEHWEITKVGWVLNYLSYGFTNPMPTSDEGPYMLTATDINFNEINFEQARTTTNDAYENFITSKSKPEQGDLLLTKDGTLGRVAVFNSTYKTCISQSIALLRPNKKYVLSYFMEAALASSKYQKKMIFDAGGTTIKHIYISILAKMNLALPDINEQLEITNYLNSEIDKFDALILKAQRAIQLMQERRTALISAAVTGKIDVRGWRAHE